MANGLAEPDFIVPEPIEKKTPAGVEAAYGKPVEDLVAMFDDAATTASDARSTALRERQYYNGKQWTAEERAAIEKRGEPVITVNRIRRKIDYLRGAEQQNRTDPRAYPRNPDDEAASEAATDALRYVEEREMLDDKFSQVWENMLIEGYGGVELIVEPSRRPAAEGAKPEYEIRAKCWAWDRLFYDPHSSQDDFSDASYLGGITWMDRDEAMAAWPSLVSEIDASFDTSLNETYEDKPRWQKWVEKGKRQRIKVVQIYYRHEGEWCWAHFTRGAILDGGPVAFQDDDGATFCPLMLQSAYIDEENNRHGIVRDMMSPQDEINKRRSKLLHLVNVRQSFGNQTAISDVDEARRELAKPDGHVELQGGAKFGNDFGIIPTTDLAMGQVNLLQEAKAEIDMMGPNAAMSGKGDIEASGRSILAQQQGGMIELTPLLNRLRGLKIRTYRGIWYLVKQYWTAQRWIRVTDDEENLKFVGLNKPLTMGEKAMKQAEADGLPPEQIEQMKQAVKADPQAQMPVVDPMTGQPEIENNVTEMDMDIIIEETPDYVTLQHEQFEQLASMGAPFELLLEMSSMPKKRQVLEKLKQYGPDPQAKQLAEAGAVAKIERDKAAATKDQATALKTVGETISPPPVQQPRPVAA